MNQKNIYLLLSVIAAAIQAHPSEIFKRHSMPSSSLGSSKRLGRNIENPSGVFDATIEEDKTEQLNIIMEEAKITTETPDQTTFTNIKIDENITERMTNDLLNDDEEKEERSGKQHITDIQLLSPRPYPHQYMQNPAQAPEVHLQVLSLPQQSGVLVDQFGNSFRLAEYPALLDQVKYENRPLHQIVGNNVNSMAEDTMHLEDPILEAMHLEDTIHETMQLEDPTYEPMYSEDKTTETGLTKDVSGNNDVQCIKKVMQVEETVYDTIQKCTHSFAEKCHKTFITDYAPTQEEKCSTSFEKNCHITYQPMAFDEKVEICDEPLKKFCNETVVGEEVCRTEYETSCETRLKNHTVEQDEPVCKMVMEKKCEAVVVDNLNQSNNSRRRRSIARIENGEQFTRKTDNCEEWPVQKCTLEKKTVTKSTPETSCKKHPRKVCATSNCVFVKSEKTCREETRSLVQNIPSEDCDLEPRKTCKLETVLVPRLVEKPNCVQVPKEICVDIKANPRKVTKPVIKEWCYRPSDFGTASTKEALDLVIKQL